MPQTAMDELKSMSHSDLQRFANYLGSRLRTIGKVYHTRDSTPEQKVQIFHNWRKELDDIVGLLGIFQCSGKPLVISKYIQDSVKNMDDRGGPVPVSEGWAEEDGITTLLPEKGGDWWDLSRRKDPPADTLAHLMFRWALFECPETMPLKDVDYFITAEDLEEHIAEMEGVRTSWKRLAARYRKQLFKLEDTIEEVRAQLFRADQKELAGLKKAG